MNQSPAVSVASNDNHLGSFKRWAWFGIAFVLLTAILGFVYEDAITRMLMANIPVTYEKSYIFFADLVRISMLEILWGGAILFVALLLYDNPSWVVKFEQIQDSAVVNNHLVSRVIIFIAAAIILLNAVLVLQQFPNSADEYVYLYQAETLSKGKLWEKAHPVYESFSFNHIAVKDGISVGRFPLGWPLILAIFIFFGIPPALVNPILAIVTLFIFFRFCKMLYGARVALWSLFILSFSSFFIFNSSSFFSHTSCFLETLTFAYCVYYYLRSSKIKYGLLAGLALGLIMLIRYYTAVLLFLPFGLLLLYKYKFQSLKLFVLIGLGALPCLAAFLFYNYEVTGNPLTPVTVWGFKNEGLGFINGHTFAQGIEHVVRRIMLFFYWCSPVLLIYYFVFLLRKVRHTSKRFTIPEDYLFLTFLVGYFFYYEIGGNQYGPRFYYEAFPFLIVLVVNELLVPGKPVQRILLYAGVMVMLIKFPFIAYREHEIIDQRQDVYDLATEQKLTNAIVLIGSGTCDIRPMPAGDLTRNDATFSNDVLFALDRPQLNVQLMHYYPNRSVFLYERETGEVEGKLTRLR